MTGSSLRFLILRSFSSFLLPRSGGRHLPGAALGLALSLIPLVVVMVLSQGMIQGIMDRYLETFTGHFQIQSYSGSPGALEELKSSLVTNPEIRAVYTERQGFGLAYSGSKRLGVQLRAVESGFLKDEGTQKFLKVTQGESLRGDSQEPEVLMGEQAAKRLGVKPGDQIKIMTARSLGGRGFLPRITTFRVRGLVSVGYQDLDRLWVFLDAAQGSSLLPESEYPLFLHVKTHNPYQGILELQKKLQDQIPFRFMVKSWQELARSQFENYQANRVILMVIMALIVLVASVNISSSLVMIVMEKTKDIAILKCLGCPPGAITGMFTSLGFLTGLVGTVLGIALGSLVALNLNGLMEILNRLMDFWAYLTSSGAGGFRLLNPEYYLESIPLSLNPWELGITALGSLIVSTLAAYLPARKAKGLRPVAILRKY